VNGTRHYDINRQKNKIRRSIFDFWFYNSDAINSDEAEKFIDALSGKTPNGKRILGVKAGEGQRTRPPIRA
jgi:hypothetical protein